MRLFQGWRGDYAKNAHQQLHRRQDVHQIPEPSRADEHLTRRLKDALALVEVRTLDRIVVGATTTVSFAERGLL